VDADADARRLGFGPGTTLFADVEHYRRTHGNTAAVLTYLQAFATELRTISTPLGAATGDYRLGVYGSSSSVIADVAAADLASAEDSASATAPIAAIDTAAWADPSADYRPSTDDPRLGPTQWADHQRIHQYYGNHTETYGATTLNVDANRLDMGPWAATPPRLARITGADPIATAIAASTRLWRTAADPRSTLRTAKAAVLARADDFADALSGSALAATTGGPLLLTTASALSNTPPSTPNRRRADPHPQPRHPRLTSSAANKPSRPASKPPSVPQATRSTASKATTATAPPQPSPTRLRPPPSAGSSWPTAKPSPKPSPPAPRPPPSPAPSSSSPTARPSPPPPPATSTTSPKTPTSSQ